MIVREAMSRDAPSISPTSTVLEAAALLVNTGASALPVVDSYGALLGIVSEADVIGHVVAARPAPGEGGDLHSVAGIMTREVVTVDENATLKSAIDLVLAKRLKLVPVCRGRTLVGTLGRADVVRLIASVPGATSSPQKQDESLRRHVMEAVKGHRWSLAQRFDVVVKDGAVHLWGVVPNDAVHASYCDAAEHVPEARSVISHMHVMPRGMRMTSMI